MMTIQRRKLIKRWFMRALALVISLALWLSLFGGRKVTLSKKVFLDYRLPAYTRLENAPPKEVLIKLTGPIAFVKNFERKDLVVPIRLESARPGEYELNLREEMLEIPMDLKVEDIQPRKLFVRIVPESGYEESGVARKRLQPGSQKK